MPIAARAGKGALVVLNDEIHYARNVIKTDTTNVQTFESLNRGPAGVVHTGKIEWFEPMDRKHGNATEFAIDKLDKLPRVDIIYAHANMSADLIDAAVRNGAQGLVIAGVGDGNMTKPALDALAKAAKAGVVVVRSTRLPAGIVLRNNEVNDDKMGFVASGELNPAEVARAAAARADEDEGSGANPEDVLRVLKVASRVPASGAGVRCSAAARQSAPAATWAASSTARIARRRPPPRRASRGRSPGNADPNP